MLAGLGNWYSGWKLINTAVPEAELLGFWGVAFPDHYMWGEAMGGNSTLDIWAVIAHLAAKTRKIRLGTLVTPIPLRPPAILAKIVSTIDLISKGRVFLGVGAGWSQIEFEGYSKWDEPKVRVDKTEEGTKLITELWSKKIVNFSGKYYHANGAALEPKPVQKPYPSLLFGGFKRRMLRLAGKYGDICYIPAFQTKFSFSEGKDITLLEAKRFGREDKISFAAGISFGLKYSPKYYVRRVEEAQRDGCDYFIVPFPRGDKKYLESMRDFGKNILPSFIE